MAELAWELRISQPERSRVSARKAISLAGSGEYADNPYTEGLAAGLVTLAFVYLQSGQLQEGTNKCLEALNAIGDSPHSKTTVRIWHTLAENSFFLGDFPAAMEQAQKSLTLADQLDLLIEKAWAIDTIASIYGITGDSSNALEFHKEAMQMFNAINDIDGILRSGNNLAMTLYGKKDYSQALEQILNTLEIAREWDRKHDMLNISCTAAQISIDMGQLEQAEGYLHAAFSNAEVLENTYTYHVFVMMEWARLSLLRNETKKARSYLLQAIVVAEENDQLTEQAQCYKTLAEICEQEGNEEKALMYSESFQLYSEELERKLAKNRLALQYLTQNDRLM